MTEYDCDRCNSGEPHYCTPPMTMDADEARERLCQAIDVQAMKHARLGVGPDACVGEHTLDAVLNDLNALAVLIDPQEYLGAAERAGKVRQSDGYQLTGARAALEEPLPSRTEIEECREFALSSMEAAAQEFCCGPKEHEAAGIQSDRVQAVFDAFLRSVPS